MNTFKLSIELLLNFKNSNSQHLYLKDFDLLENSMMTLLPKDDFDSQIKFEPL